MSDLKKIELCILFPVLNERLRLKKGVLNTIEFLEKNSYINYSILIVDNGSSDETPEIASELCKVYPQVQFISIGIKGVGAAFRKGVFMCRHDYVGYMDVDLSTDVRHLMEVIDMFSSNPQIDIINGSRFSHDSDTSNRKWYRNITSYGLIFILKLVFSMKSSDAICGFKFFRKDIALQLMSEASDDNGWFYIIELILRAERKNINIKELPVKWIDDHDSKVKVFKLTKYYITEILKQIGRAHV